MGENDNGPGMDHTTVVPKQLQPDISVSGEDNLDGLFYRDVRVNGSETATVTVRGDTVKVAVYDPQDPTDTIEVFEFEKPPEEQ